MAVPNAPTYSLASIQEKVRANAFFINASALDGAFALGWDRTDIVDCVLQLDDGDFYKSVVAYCHTNLMQDVYRTRYLGVAIYLKLQLTSQAIVVSFKEDWSQ